MTIKYPNLRLRSTEYRSAEYTPHRVASRGVFKIILRWGMVFTSATSRNAQSEIRVRARASPNPPPRHIKTIGHRHELLLVSRLSEEHGTVPNNSQP